MDGPSEERSARLPPWLATLTMGPPAVLLVVALEAMRVPRSSEPAAIFVLGTKAALVLLAIPLAGSLAAAALFAARVPRRAPTPLAVSLPLAASLAAILTAHPWTVVAEDESLRFHPPLLALFAVLFLLLTAALGGASRGRFPRRLALATAAIGVVGFVATTAANRLLYLGAYPTLHAAMLVVSYLLLHTGLASTALAFPRPAAVRRGAIAVSGLVAVALVGALASVSPPSDAVAAFRRFTDLGRFDSARLEARSPAPDLAPPSAAAEGPDASDPLATFAAASGLPSLPEDFRLGDHDILLISIETTRCRDTTLCQPELRTTPAIAAFAEAHGVTFTRAYSPAAATLASMSSIHAMSFPSWLALTLRTRWHGRLEDAEVTVAELLAASGYHTFYAGHDYKGHFTRGGIRGLHQGFVETHFAPGGHGRLHDPTTDATVARLAIEALGRRREARGREARGREARGREAGGPEASAREGSARFFGWLFFESPHEPYLTRPPLTDDAWAHQRYRREIRNADTHVGRVLDDLEAHGMLDETIVIVHADHGEAFGEHERAGHADVYSEVSHVPLVVHVPGMGSGRSAKPTSLAYLFPWLLLRAEGAPREHAERLIRERLAPLLERTEGAVLTEMICDGCGRVSLVGPRYRIVRDEPSGYLELYDLDVDPREANDIFDPADPISQRWSRRLQGYDALRARRR